MLALLDSALQRRPEGQRDAGWQDARADLKRLIDWTCEQEAETPALPAPPAPPPPPDGPGAGPDPDDPDADDANGPSAPDLELDGQPTAYSDEALVLQLAEHHAHQIRHVAAWHAWMIWDGVVWCADDDTHVFSLLRQSLRRIAQGCNKRKVQAALNDGRTVAAVEKLLRSDRRIASRIPQWDSNPWLLNTPGGVVDLRTGRIREHRLTDYCTKMTAVTPGGDCPLFRAFLDRITAQDTELQDYLQRVGGYALTGLTDEHVLIFGYGTGRNGKGTLVNTLQSMMGTYAAVASVDTFIASQTDRHPCDMAMLRGARLVTAQETEEGRPWAESRIKMMTGGDPVTARFMRQDFFTYIPQFTLFITGNHRPALRGVDAAIRARIHMVPFTVFLPEAERDKRLPRKLKAEWPGILAWAIEGCLKWRKAGLAMPAVVAAATGEYFGGEDLIDAWVATQCDIADADADAATYTEFAYHSFRTWMEDSGERPKSRRWFSGALKDHGYDQQRETRQHNRDQMFTRGLLLKNGLGAVPPRP